MSGSFSQPPQPTRASRAGRALLLLPLPPLSASLAAFWSCSSRCSSSFCLSFSFFASPQLTARELFEWHAFRSLLCGALASETMVCTLCFRFHRLLSTTLVIPIMLPTGLACHPRQAPCCLERGTFAHCAKVKLKTGWPQVAPCRGTLQDAKSPPNPTLPMPCPLFQPQPFRLWCAANTSSSLCQREFYINGETQNQPLKKEMFKKMKKIQIRWYPQQRNPLSLP